MESFSFRGIRGRCVCTTHSFFSVFHPDCGVAAAQKGRVRARRGRESVAAINFNESFEQESRSHIHSLTRCSGLVHAQPPPSLLHLLDGGLLWRYYVMSPSVRAGSLARSPPNRWIFLNGASSFFRSKQGCRMGKFRDHYVNMEKREEEKWQTFSHSPRPRMRSSGRRRGARSH